MNARHSPDSGPLPDWAGRSRYRPFPAFSASIFHGTRRCAVRPFRCRPPRHCRKGRWQCRRRPGRVRTWYRSRMPSFGCTLPDPGPGAWSCKVCRWTLPRRVPGIRSENINQLRPRQSACARCGSWPTAGVTRPTCRRTPDRQPCRHGISPWPPPGAARRSHGSLSGPGPAGACRTFCRARPRPAVPSSGGSGGVPPPSTSPCTAGVCPQPSVFHCAPFPWPVFFRHKVHSSCGREPGKPVRTPGRDWRPVSHPSFPGTAPDSVSVPSPHHGMPQLPPTPEHEAGKEHSGEWGNASGTPRPGPGII